MTESPEKEFYANEAQNNPGEIADYSSKKKPGAFQKFMSGVRSNVAGKIKARRKMNAQKRDIRQRYELQAYEALQQHKVAEARRGINPGMKILGGMGSSFDPAKAFSTKNAVTLNWNNKAGSSMFAKKDLAGFAIGGTGGYAKKDLAGMVGGGGGGVFKNIPLGMGYGGGERRTHHRVRHHRRRRRR